MKNIDLQLFAKYSFDPEDMPVKAQKSCLVTYLLDCSGSMNSEAGGDLGGRKIDQLNASQNATAQALRGEDGKNARIKIAVMSFGGDGVKILTGANGPCAIEDYEYVDLRADGGTPMGACFKKLDTDILNRDAYLNTENSETGWKAPIIILCTDGRPTDDAEAMLSQLQKNDLFRKSVKIAFAIGTDCDRTILTKFTGDEEAVINCKDMESFSRLCKVVSLRTVRDQSIGNVKKNADDEDGFDVV